MPILNRRKRVLQDFRTRSLLEATRRVIAREGFDAVTMERVARDAEITKGGIYLYFRNKDRMILAAVEETAAKMVRDIARRVRSRSGPWEQLQELIRAQMESMERNGELLRTLLLDRRLIKDNPRGARTRRLRQYKRQHEAGIRCILEAGVRQKVFRPIEAARAAFYLNEMAVSAAQKCLLGLARSSWAEETEGLIRFIGLLLRGHSSDTGRRR